MRIAYNLFTQKPKEELADFRRWTDQMFKANGATDPDLRDRLISALESLPEKLRTVVILHDMEGHTHQQISGLTGVPEGTSKTRLAVARAQLREALAAYAPE